jgi:hypothetical protein
VNPVLLQSQLMAFPNDLRGFQLDTKKAPGKPGAADFSSPDYCFGVATDEEFAAGVFAAPGVVTTCPGAACAGCVGTGPL